MATCVFQDGVINKPANHVDQGGVDCAENIVRVRGEVDHLNCHLLMIKGNILVGYWLDLFCCAVFEGKQRRLGMWVQYAQTCEN